MALYATHFSHWYTLKINTIKFRQKHKHTKSFWLHFHRKRNNFHSPSCFQSRTPRHSQSRTPTRQFFEHDAFLFSEQNTSPFLEQNTLPFHTFLLLVQNTFPFLEHYLVLKNKILKCPSTLTHWRGPHHLSRGSSPELEQDAPPPLMPDRETGMVCHSAQTTKSFQGVTAHMHNHTGLQGYVSSTSLLQGEIRHSNSKPETPMPYICKVVETKTPKLDGLSLQVC